MHSPEHTDPRTAFTEYTAVGGGGSTPLKDPGNNLSKDEGESDILETVRWRPLSLQNLSFSPNLILVGKGINSLMHVVMVDFLTLV